ncbi:MAG: LacI family DNA-binding transcriptional regulator [Oscillospiraceae bacterium]|nr:LacI family DNA-binding transcriptional regulator [Oscillospiraceae bacterium]MBQ8835859.1 LacI family DNA-binding transcriptional regulator [Oscillospiraceae bacterium]
MTIKDLSAQTGYSVGTISRVLNHQPNVSDKAREIILKAAAECGFQLNTNAKQLKQQHSTSILVVVKGISNELFASLVESVQARIAGMGYPLIVDYIDENDNEVSRAVQLCREKKPLGVLFLGGNREHFLQDFDKITVPCVLVTNDAAGLPFENLSSVSSDNVLAARMAIDHLVSLGHRKIVVIGGERQVSDTTKLRYQGCLEAFRQHGIAFDEELDYETARFSLAEGFRAARALLERGREFTALFAMSDVMAIGAIRALRDAGKRVPQDVAVIGLDGLAIGEYTVPRLATVRQEVEALAESSLRLLQRNIKNTPAPCHETIPVSLDPRESAATPRCGRTKPLPPDANQGSKS